ncbi:MAG: alpha/beta hydrolase [Gemmatimonadota bacterium]
MPSPIDPRTGPRPDATAYDPRVERVGSGPPLVYVPGIDGTGRLLYRQTPRLQERHTVVTYRLRDDATAMDTLIADLDRVLDAVEDLGPPTLVGESFGGALALSYALARGERIHRLVILNSFATLRPRLNLTLAAWGLEKLPWQAMARMRRLAAFRLHSPHTPRAERERFHAVMEETTRTGYVNRLRILANHDVRDRLPQLDVPTLFLAADRDHLVPAVRQGRMMERSTPDSRLEILEGHGHICLIAPDLDLAALLTRWERERSAH